MKVGKADVTYEGDGRGGQGQLSAAAVILV